MPFLSSMSPIVLGSYASLRTAVNLFCPGLTRVYKNYTCTIVVSWTEKKTNEELLRMTGQNMKLIETIMDRKKN